MWLWNIVRALKHITCLCGVLNVLRYGSYQLATTRDQVIRLDFAAPARWFKPHVGLGVSIEDP